MPQAVTAAGELTEANFDDAFAALVQNYDISIASQTYPVVPLAGSSSPSIKAGATRSASSI